VGHAVRCYFDIGSIPRRSFFEILAHFADDELEKEKLQEFCTPQGQVELLSSLLLSSLMLLLTSSLLIFICCVIVQVFN
jgi:sulfite reductase alpha subunit-like flavoprotein